MKNKKGTINDEIQDMIDYSVNNDVLYPVRGVVGRVYADGCVDVNTEEYGMLLYVPVWGSCELQDEVVVLFKSNIHDDVLVLTDYSGLFELLDGLDARLSVLESLLLVD